jgi:cyclase
VRLFATEIHSDDATLLWLPGDRLLFAGDAVEDTVTYVDEPERFDAHLANLESLRGLAPARILPNHGDPGVISAGGYEAGLLDDTASYIERLRRCRVDPAQRDLSLREFAADLIEHGTLNYFEPYEEVHRENVEKVLAAS